MADKHFDEPRLLHLAQALATTYLREDEWFWESSDPTYTARRDALTQHIRAMLDEWVTINPVDPLTIPIAQSLVPYRVWNCLTRPQPSHLPPSPLPPLRTLGDVVQYRASDLLRIHNFGRGSLAELERVLLEYGLLLKADDPVGL